jgi:hypothetical protein
MELGFFETNINGREVVAHLGDTDNFHTSLHLFLKEGVGFYVSFNSPGKGGAAGGLRGALFEDFADRYLPSTEKDGRVDSTTSAKHAAMMAGSWVNSRRAESNFIKSVGLVSQFKLGAAKGELVAPLPGLNGEPHHWVEIAPFVWREVGGHQRLAAKVVDGKVVRWSVDGLSPFMVFDRAPWYEDASWLLPLLVCSLVALTLTALVWPAAALVRRRYGATLALDRRALRAYRLSRIAALTIVAALLGWALTVGLLLSDINRLNATTDPIVRVLQIIGTVIFVGGAALLIWNLWIVWTGHRRWPARVWSVVLVLSAVVALWVAVAFKLISFGVNY